MTTFKPLTRSVRMLTAEIRRELTGQWLTQAQLAKRLKENQRAINSRLQTMHRFGELEKRNEGYASTEYRLSKEGK